MRALHPPTGARWSVAASSTIALAVVLAWGGCGQPDRPAPKPAFERSLPQTGGGADAATPKPGPPANAALDAAPDTRAPADDVVVVAPTLDASASAVSEPDVTEAVVAEPVAVEPVADRPQARSGYAFVFINARPWGKVEVDGRLRGVTPLRLELRAGKHRVRVFKGAHSLVKYLNILPGKPRNVFFDLTEVY